MKLLLGAGVLAVVTAPFVFAWFVSGFLVNAPEWFPPDLDPEALRRADPRSTHGLAFEEVRFRSEDGVDVAGWVVPGADREPGPSAAVVYVHGLGGARWMSLGLMPALHAAGLGVLAIDMRGHGATGAGAPGAAFVEGWRDVAAAVRYLREERGYERVGALGGSQGAGTVIEAVARTRGVDAVVAQSGGTSLFALLRGMSALGWAPDWQISLICRIALFRMGADADRTPHTGPIDAVQDIAPAPLLIIHGENDEVVTVDQARALFAKAREPKELWIVEGRGHADLGEAPGYEERVVGFFATRLTGEPSPRSPAAVSREAPAPLRAPPRESRPGVAG
jgi:alpha-beta hydrolase superfamily lysophospholipase